MNTEFTPPSATTRKGRKMIQVGEKEHALIVKYAEKYEISYLQMVNALVMYHDENNKHIFDKKKKVKK